MKSYYIFTLIMAIIAIIFFLFSSPILPNESTPTFLLKLIGSITISGCIGFTLGTSLFKIALNQKLNKEINNL